jgi:hypothetical protein
MEPLLQFAYVAALDREVSGLYDVVSRVMEKSAPKRKPVPKTRKKKPVESVRVGEVTQVTEMAVGAGV